ncbi:MAG: hypothetical protein K6F75_02870 [Butyrivibrio sp.]|nr:hypothetical protein [Butyrivibrio sp.]
MERDDKIRVAITAGIMAVILLILVLYVALSGKKTGESGNDSVGSENGIEAVGDDVNKDGDTDAANGASDQDGDKEDADGAGAGESKDEADAAASAGSSVDKKAVAKKKSVSGNSFYKTESAEIRNVYKGLAIDINAQMNEMATYWGDGNMEAVSDLAGLERFEAMSYKLNGTTDFLYYGDTDGTGVPNGTGLACYANDQYYYGEWSNGVRSGKGTWISFYPDYNQNVVIEHMYAGQWANDLPNGEGQEHYDYDQNYMNEDDLYVQNAIGNFTNGLYNGRMYMITVNSDYQTKEWYGDCENGTWKQVVNTTEDAEKKIAVLDEKDNTDNHIWMAKDKVKDSGIHGIITGGKVVKK